jgi:hypothetical protein
MTLLLVAMPFPVVAQQMTGGDLKALCDAQDPTSNAKCRFYILGAMEGLSTEAGLAGDKRFCLRADTSQDDMVLWARGLMNSDFLLYPADKALPAISLVGGAMAEHYPCKDHQP